MSPGAQPRRSRSPFWFVLVLAGVPFWMGARGCIEELTVGLERNAVVDPDGGTPTDPPCRPTDCEGDAPAPRPCPNGQLLPPVCELASATTCAWQFAACPDDAGTPPQCTPQDCDVVVVWTAPECADGSPPSCTRDQHGLCTLSCPPEVGCHPRLGANCPDGMFCAFPLGSCGHSTLGLCHVKANEGCLQTNEPVCGCDGRSYENACRASQAGVSVAYIGPCGVEPERCDPAECPEPQPLSAESLCSDGVHTSGPVCLKRSDGSCAYQWRECPVEGVCTVSDRAALEQGTCWSSADCPTGKTCFGASVCPCDAVCFAPDAPGKCR